MLEHANKSGAAHSVPQVSTAALGPASGLAGDDRFKALQAASDMGIPPVSLVIPTLNEEKNLRLLLPTIPAWVNEIVIVDGRSKDRTIDVAMEFCKQRDVKIIKEPRKGKGVALRAGFHAASGQVIIAMDADCSMEPREMLMLVSALVSGADFVKGSRFIQGGGTSDMTPVRKLGNWGLTQAVRTLFGGGFSDLCYGYFGFWKKHLCLLDPTTDGFEVETFINVMALKHSLKIAEVPSFESDRVNGESNLRAVPDGWRVLKTILRERFTGRRDCPPS